MGRWSVKVYGEAVVADFARKQPGARKPLVRFLVIVSAAVRPHLATVKEAFATADYAPATGAFIFDIGGNKCRLIARVDFAEQLIVIQTVLTYQEYDREEF